MYIYYVLRGTRNTAPVEQEGDITEELFPGVDLGDGPILISTITQQMQTEGETAMWEECDLTDSFFNREDPYIFFHNRWLRRAETPWRKDRNN